MTHFVCDMKISITLDSEAYSEPWYLRHNENPFKHLRWSFLQKKKLFSQKAPSLTVMIFRNITFSSFIFRNITFSSFNLQAEVDMFLIDDDEAAFNQTSPIAPNESIDWNEIENILNE